ncbi:acetylserotonin O-methyltransferase [Streptomyces sp. NBC_01381]|uniref:methyltransferase n=1 Tax=Streptomyces sp. NBC_01381 TaxID=2903845 RepID=UPI00224E4C61|nr:methyltransferase [Streptomyces sp. NBC_01381]MCX4670936.1 acetylserotonin O-methyltransferase [Streptomyces sp. NBC_01381]
MMPRALENTVYGLISTPVLHTALKHGVFASLIEQGPDTVPGLAERLSTDPDTLERMLLVLTSLGVVERSKDGEFALTAEAAPFLDHRNSRYLGGFIEHLTVETQGRLTRLDTYLADGKQSGEASPFDDVYRDSESLRAFMRAMWDLSFGMSQELAALAGLSGTTHLVDVGGATGPFAVAALLAEPGLRATVFDMPAVAPLVGEDAEARPVVDRLGFAGGDFFADELPRGDCLAFGYILSDWDDDTCVRLLEKAYRACDTTDGPGRVLIMDRLFDDDHTGPLATAAMNLVMHIEMAGRHRTAAEFIALLERAGFTDCEVRRSSAEKHLVIGHKKA